ncbi:LETM1 domain-containing protein 1-like [Mya arenaria]|uniref:LETM1 domain-containing protein 1-like n=1 Tax=Mya arenaria TaxID=6604 RepID=UPI0022E0B271|nr:LETM1 domain-containing protein 1-like [Mya arenaria]
MINMQAFCLRTEYILRNGHKLKCLRWHPSLRCLSTDPPHDPKDTIGPPTKLWRYVVKSLKKLVETSEKKLEKNLPKVYKAYETVKCVRFITADAKVYFSVTTDLWTGKELHTFTRRELEIYQEMPRDFVKVALLLAVASIPFVGNGIFVIGYWFPHVFFTHHLWNENQKQEFGQINLKHRINHYHQVLREIDHIAYRNTEGAIRDSIMTILDKIEHSGHPSPEELLSVREQFQSAPFSLEYLSTRYSRLLSKVNSLRKSREKLEQDCLITLHIDRAMVKEGIDDMQDTEMCRACLKRGLNPYGLSREERIKFLQAWTTISQNLDEKGLSLLLHCPVFLTYNAPTNINLMKGKRYKWRRISPV